jgi:hypothetical protein
MDNFVKLCGVGKTRKNPIIHTVTYGKLFLLHFSSKLGFFRSKMTGYPYFHSPNNNHSTK